jgi:Tfp pilus assembly protein PilV
MARLRSDSGFALIEAIVSAAVLAMVALAVLSGIDGAAASSGREKARNVAASLAETDQERLRALPVTTLANYANAASNVVPDPAGPPFTVGDPTGVVKTVDGVQYRVLSSAQWVADDTSGSVSCTTDSHAAKYFHITSTVTSAVVGKRIAPVTIDSIAAPNVAYSSTNGTLAVQVLDANGAPVVNKQVTITGGTPPPPASTNAAGCAVFQQVATNTAGQSYTASAAGCVDHFGNNPSTTTATVNAGKITLVTLPCGAPASITPTVYTYAPGSTPASHGTKIASKAFQISVINSGETGMLRSFPTTKGANELATYPATSLFPFTTKYTFFTGNCHYNDPTDTRYGSANTASPNGALIAGQQVTTQLLGADVYQPPLNIQLTKSSSGGNSWTTTYTVYAIPVAPSDDDCAQPRITLSTFNVGTTASPKWMVGRSYDSTNKILDAGVPYGSYSICFASGSKDWVAGTYDNTTPPTGKAAVQQYGKSTAWSTGTCPTS